MSMRTSSISMKFVSVVNQQEYIEEVPEIHFDCQDGEALQLLEIKENGSFALNHQTADIIKQADGYTTFCSIVGKYRTGKSFLINKILELQYGNQFKVSSSLNACTRGLWIWSRPIYIEKDNLNIFLLDSEGLDSVTSSNLIDTKLFSIVVLLSSYIIYNSFGAIDEATIQNLSLITHMIQTVSIEEGQKTMAEYQLSQYAPKFLWLLRDFVLEIQDTSGRRVSSKLYLESALKDIPFSNGKPTRDVQMGLQIRQSILDFFTDRDCMTMLRPVQDEKQLQKANELPIQDLRPEFTEQVNGLREKIYRSCGLKIVNGLPLTPAMMIDYASQLINAFNNGKTPSIQSAWKYLLNANCQEYYDEAVRHFLYSLGQINQNDNILIEDLHMLIKSKANEAIIIFKQCSGIKEYNTDLFNHQLVELTKNIKLEAKKFISHFLKQTAQNNNFLLERLLTSFLQNIKYEDREDLNLKFSKEVLESFVQQSNGGDCTKDISDYTKQMSFLILTWYEKNQQQFENMKRRSFIRKTSAAEEKYQLSLERLRLQEEKLNQLQTENEKLDEQILKQQNLNAIKRIQEQKKEFEKNNNVLSQLRQQAADQGNQLSQLRSQIDRKIDKRSRCC